MRERRVAHLVDQLPRDDDRCLQVSVCHGIDRVPPVPLSMAEETALLKRQRHIRDEEMSCFGDGGDRELHAVV
jgi:hypothetical protein